MLELVINSISGNDPVKYGDRYRIVETHQYIFKIKNDFGNYLDGKLQIDGIIDDFGENRFIELNSDCGLPFINCLGFFSLSYEGDFIAEVEVITTKLTNQDASDLFEYVYNIGQDLFKIYTNKDDLNKHKNLSIKQVDTLSLHIYKIRDLVICLNQSYQMFKSKPLYKIRTQHIKSDFNEKKLDEKSIEWVLQNLDNLIIDNSLENHPDSFPIADSFAISPSILANEKTTNLDIYENSVILGIVKALGLSINKMTALLSSHLDDEILHFTNYASFESIKRSIIKTELDNLLEIKKRYSKVNALYSNFFTTVTPIYTIPRLTHNFKKERHYFRVFDKIIKFKNSDIIPENLELILGIKNLDRLYELYNFFRIIEIFKNKFGTPIDFKYDYLNHSEIKLISFEDRNIRYNIYNEVDIRNKHATPKYPWFKLFCNSSNLHYKPDIVIEKIENKSYSYAIMDSKYSKQKHISPDSSTTGNITQKLIGKYYFLISHRDNIYRKADYLYLLYPGKNETIHFTVESGYYPVIGTIPSSTGNVTELENVILSLLVSW